MANPKKPATKAKAPARTRKAPVAKAKPKVKKKTGRKCSICHHKEVSQINAALHSGVSFRNIASQVMQNPKAYASVCRHAENCLKIELAALIQKKKEEQAIDVYEEFEQQLQIAKALRLACWEYLSDPTDPMKISLIPFAHEIEISYFDNTDLTEGKFPKPKKKRTTLDRLIMQVEQLRNLDVDKISIKHVDLRSYAVEVLRAVDMTLDKFAKIGGVYKKEAPAETDPEMVARKVVDRLVREHNWEMEAALSHVATIYQLREPLALNAAA